MIIYKTWLQSKGPVEWQRDGWYLFGFLPLLVRDLGPRGRVRS